MPISKQPEKLRFHSVSCEMLATVDGQQDAFPGVGTKCQSPSSRKNGGFTASAVKCWPQLTASKTLFQELARQRQSPPHRNTPPEEQRFRCASCEMPVSLLTGKLLFQELARSANLPFPSKPTANPVRFQNRAGFFVYYTGILSKINFVSLFQTLYRLNLPYTPRFLSKIEIKSIELRCLR